MSQGSPEPARQGRRVPRVGQGTPRASGLDTGGMPGPGCWAQPPVPVPKGWRSPSSAPAAFAPYPEPGGRSGRRRKRMPEAAAAGQDPTPSWWRQGSCLQSGSPRPPPRPLRNRFHVCREPWSPQGAQPRTIGERRVQGGEAGSGPPSAVPARTRRDRRATTAILFLFPPAQRRSSRRRERRCGHVPWATPQHPTRCTEEQPPGKG